MPETIAWLPQYEIGNEMVDREHKALFELVNLIIVANKRDNRERAVREGLAALHRYVDIHFKNEESLLRALNSKHLGGQVAEHNALRQELKTLWSFYDDAPSTKVIHELSLWAKNRLLRHFICHDCSALNAQPLQEAGATP